MRRCHAMAEVAKTERAALRLIAKLGLAPPPDRGSTFAARRLWQFDCPCTVDVASEPCMGSAIGTTIRRSYGFRMDEHGETSPVPCVRRPTQPDWLTHRFA